MKLLPQHRTGIQRDGLQDLIDDLPSGLVMVEIGCFSGESAEMFLQSGKINKLYGIDSWSPSYTSKCSMQDVEGAFDVVQARHKGKIIKLKGVIDDYINELLDIDFAYIDGDHSYGFVKNDIQKTLTKLKPNGFISGHDYNHPGVRGAVNEVLGLPDKIYEDFSWVFWNVLKIK